MRSACSRSWSIHSSDARWRPHLPQAGLTDLAVHFEPDRLFTNVGQIDPERRRNWMEQLTPARPHIARIMGDEGLADQFVDAFLSFQGRPVTSSYTTLF